MLISFLRLFANECKNLLPTQIYARLTPLQEKAAYFYLVFPIIYSIVYSGVMSVHAQLLAVGGYEKTPEAAPMSCRASSSQLQDGPASGQSSAHQ